MSAWRLTLLLALGALAPAELAHADEGDGVYRRFDGDLAIGLEVGGGYRLRTRGDAAPESPYVDAALRFRVLDTGGPFVAWRHGLASPDAGVLLVGVELRPLFPALYLLDIRLPEYPALLLESIGLELGAIVGPFGREASADHPAIATGLGWMIGLALEVPLVLPSWVRAPWRSLVLRASARRTYASPNQRLGPDARLEGWELGLTLGLRLGVDTGLAAWEPRRYE